MAFDQQIKEIEKARISSAAADAALYEAKLKALKENSSVTPEALSQQLAAQQRTNEAARNSLQQSVTSLYADQSQQSLVANWNSKFPVLLLPLRLEVKFMDMPNRVQELWVRIYPDDIAVQQHEPLLSEKEFSAGKNYWMNFFDAEKSSTGQENGKANAWIQLKNSFGANRSVWIAKQSLPTNWAARSGLPKKEDLLFPVVSTFKSAEWTAPPRSQVLPDKFVVTMFNGNSKVLEQEGNLVPDTLILGHDPFQGPDAFTKTDFGITFAKEFLWMSDFEEAVKIGMALKIQLNNQVYSDPSKRTIDKIIVLGVYLSADELHSQNVLGDLLAGHRYTSGLAIIPQGTPTNNTSDSPSAFTKNEDPQQKGYFEMNSGTLFQNNPECDGNRLAKALSIDASIVEGILHDTQKDHEEAVIMNRALFPATIGYYFDTLLDNLVADKYVTILRNFFERHVTGSGPLPAIRVGDQPYGLLVTSDFTKWRNVSADADQQSFYNQLLNWLNFFSSQWEAEVKNVMYAGRERDSNNAQLKAEDVFLDIIGLEPSSLRFERRTGFYKDLPLFRTTWAKLDLYKNEVLSNENLVKQKLADTSGILPTIDILFTGLLFKGDNKVFIPEKNLVDGLPNLESRPLNNIQQIGKNYLEWLRDIDVLEDIEKQNFSGANAPNFLLYLLARHALLLEIRRAALAAFKKINAAINASALDKTYINFTATRGTPNRDLTIWEVLYADLSKLNMTSSDTKIKTLGQQILKNNPANIKSLKSNFGHLSTLPTARLERLLTGHLDCLTYRLDAWQSGLFYDRLEKNRSDVAGKGIYLGAFGYLENLSPAAKTVMPADKLPKNLQPPEGGAVFSVSDNAGLMQAPSLDHAAAAALLMAGYRNNASPQEPGAFAVNLSSSRIRKATQLLEGVRNGQSVEALLGYQFERGCHEKTIFENLNLNQFILAFRDKYPIENQYNEQEGETVNPNDVFRTVAANVVNGLKVANETNATAFQNLMQPVRPGMAASELATLVAAAKAEAEKLSDTLDAVKDLLLSESVFQVASGNSARTGAVLDALREGAVPPDPAVIKTPRRSRFTFQHILSVHFPQGGTVPSSWGNLSPRSQFEPGLNSWLASIIGDPANIMCMASHKAGTDTPANPSKKITLSDLSLQPVDFLYVCGKDTGAKNISLERRIAHKYRSLTGLQTSQVVDIDLSGKTAGAKSFGEVIALMNSLFAVMSQSRAIHARDYLPFRAGQAKSDGVDVNELKTRVNTSIGQLKTILLALSDAITNDTSKIADQRIALAAFDITDAWPLDIPAPGSDDSAYIEESTNVLNTANGHATNAQSVIDSLDEIAEEEEKTNMLVKIAKILLGANFPVMPKFKFANAPDIKPALNDSKQLVKYYAGITGLPDAVIADDWLQSVAEVRTRTGLWEYARSLAEINSGKELALVPFQLPYRKNDNWLAVEFPKTDATTGEPFGIKTDTISCTVVWPEGNDIDGPQSGLLLDEWSETIPTDTETTGIAFHYNQPDSMPPQALLLAVYPGTENNWTWDALIGTVTDTFRRAKMRAVEPKHFTNNQLVQHFLPGIIAPVNISGNNISLDFAVASDDFLKRVPRGADIYEAHVKSANL